MTEAEMKTKWCAFVRTGLRAGMAVNRHVADKAGAVDGVFDETRCLGSDCAHWRWAWVPVPSQPECLEISTTEGYCGLAGKPGGQP